MGSLIGACFQILSIFKAPYLQNQWGYHHINGISRLSTFIQRKFELHSKYKGHVYYTLGLAHSCCEVTTPQHYRYIGAVGSHLNYPQTEYGAPTSLVCATGQVQNRTLKAVITILHLPCMTRSSVQVRKCVRPTLAWQQSCKVQP